MNNTKYCNMIRFIGILNSVSSTCNGIFEDSYI